MKAWYPTLLVVGLVACGHPRATDVTAHAADRTLWLLAADPSEDAVHATDSEATLRVRYGAANVLTDSIHLGEGEMALGTVLYPTEPTRRLEILWADTVARARPAWATVGGAPSRWAVWPGVRMWTPLADLERLNGRPFHLYAFGTHGEGTVDNWAGGRLDPLWGRSADGMLRVIVRLTPSAERDASSFGGEWLMRSDRKGLAELQPVVYDLSVVPR